MPFEEITLYMSRKNRHSTVTRRNDILTLLADAGQVFVDELSEKFEVSEVTIRNDLDQLEQKNLLVRARGGAMKVEGRVGIDYGIDQKDKINYEQKVRIGKRASEMVNDDEIIIIDSGTTTAELAKNLTEVKDVTVITNALNIATILSSQVHINLIVPGGFMRKNSFSLVGPMAEKSLRNFNVDRVFLGVDGFDTRQGIFTPNIEEAHLNEVMIEISNEVVLLSDSSKFKKRSFAFICGLQKIQTVITDAGIEADDRQRLEDAGLEVIIV